MADSNSAIKKANKSKTNPQYSATLRKIMLLDSIMQIRASEYEERLSAYINKAKSRSSGLTEKEISGLEVVFSQMYFNFEFKAMAEYDALLKEKSELEPSDENLERISELSFYTGMGKEAYVAHKMFDRKVIDNFKKSFPKADRDIAKQIKEFAGGKSLASLPNNLRTRPATVALFNAKYPNLNNELGKMSNTSDGFAREAANAAKVMLKHSSALANPTGYLVSQAVGAILRTKTFQPLVESTAQTIKLASEKTGLTKAAKNSLSKLSDVNLKRVSLGVAAGCAGALLVVGVLQTDEAIEFAQNLSDSISSLSSPNMGVADTPSVVSDNSSFKMMDESLSSPTYYDEKLGDLFPFNSGAEVEPNYVESDMNSLSNQTVLEPSLATSGDSVLQQSDAGVRSDGAPELLASESTIEIKTGVGEVSVLEHNKLNPVDSVDVDIEPPSTVIPQQSYTVVAGDTLSEIVESKLQESGRPYDYELISDYMELIKASNDLDSIDVIGVNQVLELPSFVASPDIVSPSQLVEAANNSVAYDPEMFSNKVVSQAQVLGDSLIQSGLKEAIDSATFPPSVTGNEFYQDSPRRM